MGNLSYSENSVLFDFYTVVFPDVLDKDLNRRLCKCKK